MMVLQVPDHLQSFCASMASSAGLQSPRMFPELVTQCVRADWRRLYQMLLKRLQDPCPLGLYLQRRQTLSIFCRSP